MVRALLKDGIFKPRAVTRNANSESAMKLAALGCEIAEAELADKDAVKRAVTGAECVFLVRRYMLGLRKGGCNGSPR